MNIQINGDTHSFEQRSTLRDIIDSLDLDGKFAIELNQTIIPRSEYTSTKINSGDCIEIVQAIGGG